MALHRFMGVRLDPVSRGGLFDFVRDAVARNARVTIGHINVHGLNLAARDAAFRAAVNGFDLVYCDGVGVKLAARLSGLRVPERMTAPDWIEDFCREFGPRGIFVVGHRQETLDRGLDALRERVPSLKAAGHHGYFGAESGPVLAAIREFRPAVVLVGMGMPLQERWIRETRGRIEAPVVMAVGAMLEWVAGTWSRGPRWMTDHGGEWAARLVAQPGHVWRRYLLGNPAFVMRWLYGLLS
jgi:N-acetylglucosaminyldiphosphoundecaprenol N-acetyl-beta-D-mannosaminyltransferase